ncbi:tetratricopeptide repeat protein [Streptomyces massasporeus]|uniref:hypothetical protein n=1 Tax=Streptomyces massasporeus TaxID=67324 RepID=UPI0037F8C8B8
MSNRSRIAELAELEKDLPLPVRAFVTDLRTYFLRLEISVRLYAVRRHVSAATLSRYLSGKRPVAWKFVEELLADVTEHTGVCPTPEAIDGLRVLHEADRACRRPARGLDGLEERLLKADEEVSRLRVQERALAKALEESEGKWAKEAVRSTGLQTQADDLQDRCRAQESALVLWQNLSMGLCTAFSSLEQEVAFLRQALSETRAALKAAKAHRSRLEERLQAAEDLLEQGISGASLMDVLEAADRTTPVPELVQLVGGLATGPREAFASELVTSASRCRPVSEVQALLSSLYAMGLHKHAEAALPAMVAMRPVQDTADLVTELLNARLDEPVVALLKAAVELHTPHDLAALADAIHQHGRDDTVLVLLGATASHRAPHDIVTICHLAASNGLETILHQAITIPAAQRPVAQLTDLIIQLHHSRLQALAGTLQSALALERTATDVAELIAALHLADLPDAAAAVFLQTQQRTTGHLVALTSALHTANLYEAASEVLFHALQSRPVRESARLIADLHIAGRLQEASTALATALRHFDPNNVRSLLGHLDQTQPIDARLALLETAARCSADDAADIMTTLADCHLPAHAEAVYHHTVQARPSGHAGAALLRLHRRHPDDLAPHTLHAQAQAASSSETTNLCLALHTAGLDAHLDAVLLGGALERPAPQAALLVSNLENLHRISNGQSTHIRDRLLTRAARELPVDDKLAWISALEASRTVKAAQHLITAAWNASGRREFRIKLYAMRVTGRLVPRGSWNLTLWRLRRIARIFD